MLTLEMIQEAQAALKGVVRRTPLDAASKIADNLYIKAENLQLTGAFKLRGAYNKILSLTPEEAARFSSQAKAEGFGVIIAAAGEAAHLAGVLAAHTTLPVIGIPIKSSTLDGLDALLATVQMPKGIPVATVAIDGADNAALLAVQILALSCEELSEKLETMKEQMAQGVAAKDRAIQEKVKEL